MLYKVVLVSAIQQCKYTYASSLLSLPSTSLTPSHPPRLLTEYWVEHSNFPRALIYIWKWTFFSTTLSPLYSPHPLLPLCPQVCYLCLFLCFCPADRLISIIFLDSIYMYVCYYAIFFFSLWLTSLCITGSKFIHLSRTDPNPLLFLLLSNIPLYKYTTLLYPFICQWTSRLLLCPIYCK